MMAAMSGLFASFLSFGLSFGEAVEDAVLESGTDRLVSRFLGLALLMTAAGFVSVIIASVRLTQLGTWHTLVRGDRRLNSWLQAGVMGIQQFTGFALFTTGSVLLGDLGLSAGFAIFNVTGILTVAVTGYLQGNWVGAPRKAFYAFCLAVLLLVIGVILNAVAIQYQ